MVKVDTGKNDLTAILVQQEIEGRLHAHKAVIDVLELYDVGIVICLGIAGCLTDDLRLGDVVYTGFVSDILDHAKASDTDGQLVLEFSPTPYETPREITNSINLLRTTDSLKPLHQEWSAERGGIAQTMVSKPFPGRGDREEQVGPPRSKNGKIVCGDISKSPRYNKKLSGVDRKFLAIETESGGVFAAAKQRKIPALTIRGLSDHADMQKNKLEAETGGAIRTIAAANAATFLKLQLANPRFQERLASERGARTKTPTTAGDVCLPLDDVQSILVDAQAVVSGRLSDLSLEFKHREKEYRLPVPRVRKIIELGGIEKVRGEREKEVEVIEAIINSPSIVLSVPRNYPDTSLAWIIADYVLTAPVDEEHLIPIVVDCTRIRSSTKGIDAAVERDLLKRCLATKGVKPVLIVENPPLQSTSKSRLLIDELTNHTNEKIVVICREDGNTVAQSDLKIRIGADGYALCGISFTEMAGFIESSFEMSTPEAEVIALRLQKAFDDFDLSAHPSYLAGIPKQILFKILEANGRAELIGLAVEGFLLLLVADDEANVRIRRSRRADFLRMLAVQIKVEKRKITHGALIESVKAFAEKYDFEIDPLEFIKSYIDAGIVHFDDDEMRFSLPFIERHLLATELSTCKSLARKYFRPEEDDFDFPTFDLYAEMRPDDDVINEIMEFVAKASRSIITNRANESHLLLTDELKPALLFDQGRLLKIKNRLVALADEVKDGKSRSAEKQKVLDMAEYVKRRAEEEAVGPADENHVDARKEELDRLGHVLSIGVVLLGSGAENLVAGSKKNLTKNLIIIAAHLIDQWTRAIRDVNFPVIKKAVLDDGFFKSLEAESGKTLTDQRINDAKLLLAGVFDMMEFSLLASPLRTILNFLCERANSKVLAVSLEKAAITDGIEGVVYSTWLSDVDTMRGNAPLLEVLKKLPNAMFLRLGVASHLMTRVYWEHWRPADRHLLLSGAEQAIKPFMTLASKSEIMRTIDNTSSKDEAATTATARARGKRPSKEEKRKRRSQRKQRRN